MIEFKKLSAVDAVETVSETAHVLIEEDGVIKRAPKEEVGGAPKKELVYEWNFGLSDEVYEVVLNTNDDLSWVFNKDDNIEVEASYYGHGYDDDGDSILLEDIESILVLRKLSGINPTIIKSNTGCVWFNYAEGSPWVPSYPLSGYPYLDIYMIGNAHVDDDWNYTNVEQGGCIEICTAYWPFKSIKIYKILS